MTESSCRTHSSSIANSDWQTNRATAFNMQKHEILWHTKTWSSFILKMLFKKVWGKYRDKFSCKMTTKFWFTIHSTECV